MIDTAWMSGPTTCIVTFPIVRRRVSQIPVVQTPGFLDRGDEAASDEGLEADRINETCAYPSCDACYSCAKPV